VEALQASGKLWAMSPAERRTVSRKIRRLVWLPIDHVLAVYGSRSGEPPSGFVDEAHRDVLSRYLDTHATLRRQPPVSGFIDVLSRLSRLRTREKIDVIVSRAAADRTRKQSRAPAASAVIAARAAASSISAKRRGAVAPAVEMALQGLAKTLSDTTEHGAPSSRGRGKDAPAPGGAAAGVSFLPFQPRGRGLEMPAIRTAAAGGGIAASGLRAASGPAALPGAAPGHPRSPSPPAAAAAAPPRLRVLSFNLNILPHGAVFFATGQGLMASERLEAFLSVIRDSGCNAASAKAANPAGGTAAAAKVPAKGRDDLAGLPSTPPRGDSSAPAGHGRPPGESFAESQHGASDDEADSPSTASDPREWDPAAAGLGAPPRPRLGPQASVAPSADARLDTSAVGASPYDVIILQEVFSSPYLPCFCRQRALIRELRRLGYTYVARSPRPSCAAALCMLRWTDSGLLILSRLPISASDSMAFGTAGLSLDSGAAKGVVYARIQVTPPTDSSPGHHLDVFNCHLQATHSSGGADGVDGEASYTKAVAQARKARQAAEAERAARDPNTEGAGDGASVAGGLCAPGCVCSRLGVPGDDDDDDGAATGSKVSCGVRLILRLLTLLWTLVAALGFWWVCCLPCLGGGKRGKRKGGGESKAGAYESVRRSQLHELVRFIQRKTHGTTNPWALAGDFNVDAIAQDAGEGSGLAFFSGAPSTGESEAYQRLMRALAPLGADSGRFPVRDLLKVAKGMHVSTRPPRLQFPTSIRYLLQHKYPQRLDYVFGGGGGEGDQLAPDLEATNVVEFRLDGAGGASPGGVLARGLVASAAALGSGRPAPRKPQRRVQRGGFMVVSSDSSKLSGRPAGPDGGGQSRLPFRYLSDHFGIELTYSVPALRWRGATTDGSWDGASPQEAWDPPGMTSMGSGGDVLVPLGGMASARPSAGGPFRRPQPVDRGLAVLPEHGRSLPSVGEVVGESIRRRQGRLRFASQLLGPGDLGGAPGDQGPSLRAASDPLGGAAGLSSSSTWSGAPQPRRRESLSRARSPRIADRPSGHGVSALRAPASPDDDVIRCFGVAFARPVWCRSDVLGRFLRKLVPHPVRATAWRLASRAGMLAVAVASAAGASAFIALAAVVVSFQFFPESSVPLPSVPGVRTAATLARSAASAVTSVRRGLAAVLVAGLGLRVVEDSHADPATSGLWAQVGDAVPPEAAAAFRMLSHGLTALGWLALAAALLWAAAAQLQPERAWACLWQALFRLTRGQLPFSGADSEPARMRRRVTRDVRGGEGVFVGTSLAAQWQELASNPIEWTRHGSVSEPGQPGQVMPEHAGGPNPSVLPTESVGSPSPFRARRAPPPRLRLLRAPSRSPSPAGAPIETMYDTLLDVVNRYGYRECLGYTPRRDPGTATPPGADVSWLTFAEVYAAATCLGSGLHDQASVKPGERVGILGFNSKEWLLTDLACCCYSLVSVVLHAPMSRSDERRPLRHLERMLRRSKCSVIVCDRLWTTAVIDAAARGACPGLRAVVQTSPLTHEEQLQHSFSGIRLLAFDYVTATGRAGPRPHAPPHLTRTASVTYDFGPSMELLETTHTHASLAASVKRLAEHPLGHSITRFDVHVSYLSLAYEGERAFVHLMLSRGGAVGFVGSAESGHLAATVTQMQPTVLLVTPALLKSGHAYFSRIKRSWSQAYRTLFENALASKRAAVGRPAARAPCPRNTRGGAPRAAEHPSIPASARRDMWADVFIFRVLSELIGTSRIRFLLVLGSTASGTALDPGVIDFVQLTLCVPVLSAWTTPAAGFVFVSPAQTRLASSDAGAAGHSPDDPSDAAAHKATPEFVGYPVPGLHILLRPWAPPPGTEGPTGRTLSEVVLAGPSVDVGHAVSPLSWIGTTSHVQADPARGGRGGTARAGPWAGGPSRPAGPRGPEVQARSNSDYEDRESPDTAAPGSEGGESAGQGIGGFEEEDAAEEEDGAESTGSGAAETDDPCRTVGVIEATSMLVERVYDAVRDGAALEAGRRPAGLESYVAAVALPGDEAIHGFDCLRLLGHASSVASVRCGARRVAVVCERVETAHLFAAGIIRNLAVMPSPDGTLCAVVSVEQEECLMWSIASSGVEDDAGASNVIDRICQRLDFCRYLLALLRSSSVRAGLSEPEMVTSVIATTVGITSRNCLTTPSGLVRRSNLVLNFSRKRPGAVLADLEDSHSAADGDAFGGDGEFGGLPH